MAQKVAHELKEIDGKILVALSEGRNVPSNLAEELDVSRQWITQRLQQMESADYVTNVGRGVYEILPQNIPSDDRDELGIKTSDEAADVAAIRYAVRDLRTAIENGDVSTAQAAVERIEEAIGE